MKIVTSLKRFFLFFVFLGICTINIYAQSITSKIAANDNNVTLPVTLLSYSLTSNEADQIIVTWKTATEENNARFDINVSIDGKKFVPFTSIAGNADKNTPTDYQIVIDLKSKVLTGSLVFVLLLIPSIRNRKLKIAIFGLFALTLISCSEKENKVLETSEKKTFYVQLVQYDYDGKSKILAVKSIKLPQEK